MKLNLIYAVFVFTFFSINAQEPSGLKVGDLVSNFSGKDQHGQEFNLYTALENNPVVLIFYRGEWCKHCNKHLSAIHDSLSLIKKAGAIVIGVSPELPEKVKKTAEKTEVEFPLIHDTGYEIMNSFDVAFTLDQKTARKYRIAGINLLKSNGDKTNTLPVPATYIIAMDKRISYAHFDPNYKYQNRATVRAILEHL